MKIKDVCRITGLTDRTVRFYIEQGFIKPECTENYLGRRSYDFSPANVSQLHKICTLRQFGFSIEQIHGLMTEPSKSQQIIEEVQQQAAHMVQEKEAILTALQRLNPQQEYTYSELAAALEHSVHQEPEPYEYEETKKVKSVIRAISSVVTFIIVWLPLACSLLFYKLFSHDYHYPDVSFGMLTAALLFLLPSASVVLLSRFQFSRKKLLKGIALVLSVLLLPYNCLLSAGIVRQSETDSIRHYLQFDPTCEASRNTFLWELFPQYPKRSEGRYYYRHHYFCYDVYAQWTLDQEKFEQEVDRVTALFAAHEPADEIGDGYDLVQMQKGRYTCLVLYDTGDNNVPFQEIQESEWYSETYSYRIFAYDDQSLTVRYICCGGELSCSAQPHYLSLDW